MSWPTTSRHSRGYDHRWDKTRNRILKRDKYLCQPCLAEGRVHAADQVDHRIPKSKGGTDDDDNLWAINSQCHKLKTILDKGGRVKQRVGIDGWPA